MIQAIILAAIAIGIAILIMAVQIIFKKNGTFHSEEVGQSKAMRERGIDCYRTQDRKERRGNPNKIDINKL